MDRIIAERYDFVKAMQTIVVSLNNENAYFNNWVYIVPDGAAESDFLDIASDEEYFGRVVACFKRLMSKYLEDGLFVGRQLY